MMEAIAEQRTSQNTTLPETKFRRLLRRANWPLIIGSILVLILVVVAIEGPNWAPQDPMKENYTLKINGLIQRPPYPPLSNPGYPLGTDGFGRDILSRLLWAIRPTLIMVTTVAAIRLVLGIILGLIVGYSTGLRGRVLDGILSGALSIPILIVALIGITAVGIDKGLWAFIVGLALTGWAETARQVAEQTRTIKGQAYVEAAQALGATDLRILFNHILKQIMPLVWMMLAFEVSGTLLVTAELGFLGYYIGGGVWVEIADFNVANVTGLPELGQMLATALVKLTDPSALIVVGSVLFLAILGFNLLGEGLRLRLSPERMSARRPSLVFGNLLGNWIEERLIPGISGWVEDHSMGVGISVAAVILLGGWMIWTELRPAKSPVQAEALISIPGGHLWATERHDAQGTRWTGVQGPANAHVLWTYLASGGLSGGPAVTADGTVILAELDRSLVALDPATGKPIWKSPLVETPVGSPALGAQGEIYVVDSQGGLSAFSSDGTPTWHFEAQTGRAGTSGPIVARDGTIYYTRVDHVQAISSDGKDLWYAFASDNYLVIPPILSPAESFLFLKDAALAANSGAPLALGKLPVKNALAYNEPAFFVGADSQTYLRSGHEVIGWRSTQDGIEIDPPVTWDYRSTASLLLPWDVGVTPERLVWMFYATDYSDTRMVWFDMKGNTLGNTRILQRQSRLFGIDKDSIAYYCASNFSASVNCQALELGASKARWELHLADSGNVVGGALVPGKLYVAIDQGMLFAIGSGAAQQP